MKIEFEIDNKYNINDEVLYYTNHISYDRHYFKKAKIIDMFLSGDMSIKDKNNNNMHLQYLIEFKDGNSFICDENRLYRNKKEYIKQIKKELKIEG